MVWFVGAWQFQLNQIEATASKKRNLRYVIREANTVEPQTDCKSDGDALRRRWTGPERSADLQNDLSQDMSGGLALLGLGRFGERIFGCDRHLQFCRDHSGV